MPRSPLRFSVDVNRFLRGVIAKAPDVAAVELKAMMRDIGRAFTIQVQQQRLRGGPTSDSLGVRTGALRRSLGFNVQGQSLSDLIAFMGFGPPSQPWFGGAEEYAFIHQTGGVITAKNVEHLAIPGPDNRTASQVSRIDSPLDLADPRFIPWIFTDGDIGFLVFEDDRLMFLLKHSVEIPDRLNFDTDWDAFEPTVISMLGEGLKRMVDRIEKGSR